MRYLLLFCIFYIMRAFQLNSKVLKSTLVMKSPSLWDVLSINLKESARSWFIQRAERSGVDWNALTEKYSKDIDSLNFLYQIKTNSSMVYPKYYTRPFHGYDDGNLNWLAALEGEAATLSMAVNYWKNTDPVTTEQWLRNNISKNIESYMNATSTKVPENILDVGCSVGISTEYLYKHFNKCKTINGLDLSPYFVALATYRAKEEKLPITYYHQNAEYPNIKNKYDLIVCNFILHEVPREPTKQIIKEMYKLLNENGVLAIVDLDPTKVKNNLVVNTFRKWAFEVTEPHIYEYYQTNMNELLVDEGYTHVKNISNDPINTIWLGKKVTGELINNVTSKSYLESKKISMDNNFFFLPSNKRKLISPM